MARFRVAMLVLAFGAAVGFSQTTKPEDKKPAEKKVESKPAEKKSEAKTPERKVEDKPVPSTKPVENKPVETKPAETKPAETKPVEVRKPKVGISTRNTPQGAVIMGVMPDSPAAKAGLNAGDVILSIDGFAVGIVDGLEYPVQSEIRRLKGSGKFKVARPAQSEPKEIEVKLVP